MSSPGQWEKIWAIRRPARPHKEIEPGIFCVKTPEKWLVETSVREDWMNKWMNEWMKNFNRRSSHGSKRCELAQHAHSHGSHAFTHTTQIPSRGVKHKLSYCSSVHAVHCSSVHVSIIHWTLHGLQDFYYAYMIILVRAYTHWGWAHRQRVSTTFLTQKNSQILLVLLMGFKPQSFGPRVWRSTHWATPSLCVCVCLSVCLCLSVCVCLPVCLCMCDYW